MHDFPLGRFNRVATHVPLETLGEWYEIRVAIWVLQIRRLPVSTIEDEFGAAHTRCCGGPVVVHDRDQRLQRITAPRRWTYGPNGARLHDALTQKLVEAANLPVSFPWPIAPAA